MLAEVRRRCAAPVRDVRGAAGKRSRVERLRPRGQLPVSGARVAARRSLGRRRSAAKRLRLRRRLQRRRAGAAAQDARDDPPRDRRHRRADAPEHRRVVADGAGQRAVCVQRIDRRTARRRAAARRTAGSSAPQTIDVLREAIDALVVMMSPFAPHTAEEMWQMLGHAERLDHHAVAGVRRGRRQGRGGGRAGAGQRQGARAADGAGRTVRRRAAGAGAGRCGGASSHRRQDRPQGRRRQGPAGQRGGAMKRLRRLLLLVCRRCWPPC